MRLFCVLLALVTVCTWLFSGPVLAQDPVPFIEYNSANGLPIGPDAGDVPHDPFDFLTWSGDGEEAMSLTDDGLLIDTATHGGAVGGESRFWFDINNIPTGSQWAADAIDFGWQLRAKVKFIWPST